MNNLYGAIAQAAATDILQKADPRKYFNGGSSTPQSTTQSTQGGDIESGNNSFASNLSQQFGNVKEKFFGQAAP